MTKPVPTDPVVVATTLADLAALVEGMPTRLRVLAIVVGSMIRLRYGPATSEIAVAMRLTRQAIDDHVALLHEERLLIHLRASKRCAPTALGVDIGTNAIEAARKCADLASK